MVKCLSYIAHDKKIRQNQPLQFINSTYIISSKDYILKGCDADHKLKLHLHNAIESN